MKTKGINDLLVLDVSDPAHIAPVGAYDLPAEPISVYIWGGYAYVGDDDGLRVLDISDPAHPAEQGHLDITGGVQDVQVHGQYAYVLNIVYPGGSPVLSLLSVDIDDPAHPSVAGTGAIATGQWGTGYTYPATLRQTQGRPMPTWPAMTCGYWTSATRPALP